MLLFGHHHVATGSEHEVPKILEMGQQVFAGIPTYVALMWVTLLALRVLASPVSPASPTSAPAASPPPPPPALPGGKAPG